MSILTLKTALGPRTLLARNVAMGKENLAVALKGEKESFHTNVPLIHLIQKSGPL